MFGVNSNITNAYYSTESHYLEHTSADKINKLNVADLSKTMQQDDLKARGKAICELSKVAPKNGMNFWKINVDGAKLHLLGTMHDTGIIQDMPHGAELLRLVRDKKFDVVYTEIHQHKESGKKLDELISEVQGIVDGRQKVALALDSGKQLDVRRADIRLKQYESLCEINKVPYDNLFISAAEDIRPLETTDSRERLANNYKERAGYKVKTYREVGNEVIRDEDFIMGNENAAFFNYGKELSEHGNDYACCEARSNQWLSDKFFAKKADYEQKNVLWVVGSNHIPGLLVTLQAIYGDRVHFKPVLPQGGALLPKSASKP